jgi:apolipoprotein N-acyltransferase
MSYNYINHYRYYFSFFFIIQFLSLIWIIQSFSSGGRGYLILGIFLIFLLASFIAFLNYLFIKLTLIYFHQSNLKYLLLPLSISLVEILKEFVFGGFPWSPAAIIYYKNLWILNFLPFTGVYGMGILIHLFIGFIIYLQIIRQKNLSYLLAVLALIIFVIGFLYKPQVYENNQKTLNIALIQPNIYESLVQFDVLKNFERYESLTLETLKNNANIDVIIWPEGSLPIDLNNRPGLLSRVGSLINADQILILGSSAIEKNQLYNRLFVINSQGVVEQYYDKQKLVLFGEYVPFIKPFISRFLNLGMNYSPGLNQSILQLPKEVQAVPMICFESIFNYKLTNQNICQTDLVIQISNDSWFGKWYGPQQHLANSLLRSVEFQKTLIRSTPSGISAVINPRGIIEKSISNDQRNYLIYQYPINETLGYCQSKLFYSVLFLFLFFCGSFIYVRIKK